MLFFEFFATDETQKNVAFFLKERMPNPGKLVWLPSYTGRNLERQHSYLGWKLGAAT